MKPLIGITVNYDPRDTVGIASGMGIYGQDWEFVAGDYVYAVEKAGGIPILIPRTLDTKTLESMIDRMDGVLVSGGHDVDPRSYNTRLEGYCGRIVPERDEYDLYVTRYAYKTGKPLLAICRGIQIVNAAFGGTLFQDLEKEGGYKHHFMGETSPRQYPVHFNTAEEGSIICDTLGKKFEVNSYHHQAVRALGSNVKATAYSEDGVIEGIEVEGANPFFVAVQWHPEMMFTSELQLKIFKALVEASAK